jgi:hypothetical protein
VVTFFLIVGRHFAALAIPQRCGLSTLASFTEFPVLSMLFLSNLILSESDNREPTALSRLYQEVSGPAGMERLDPVAVDSIRPPFSPASHSRHLSRLDATLAVVLASVDSKRLNGCLTSLDATLTKNIGGRGVMVDQESDKDSYRNRSSMGQLGCGGKTIFQNSGAGERNSTGISEPS